MGKDPGSAGDRGEPELRASDVFIEWIANREDPGSGELEELCARHPDLAGRLRELFAAWMSIKRRLPGADSATAMSVSGVLLGDGSETARIMLDDDASPDDGESTRELLRRIVDLPADHRRYVDRGELARGGMGVIYKTWDAHLHRHLAKKVLNTERAHPPGAVSRLARFLEEAQITSQLDHPGIVPVHDLGVGEDGAAYFTMPLIKGRDLSQVFEAHHSGDPTWTLARCLNVLIKACEAVGYAHERRVVHRDLKPANIMVGRFGETYVMDWGLARILGEPDAHDLELQISTIVHSERQADRQDDRQDDVESPIVTAPGHAIGTACYMSPEQAKGMADEIGSWSDVYAIGAMLYHLLADQIPYASMCVRPTPGTIVQLVREGPPTPLRELDPGLPSSLVAVCEKAMARKAPDRYPSALDIARDLEAYLSDRAPEAATPSRFELLRLAVRRNKGIVLTATGAVALIIVLLVVYVAQQVREAEVLRRSRDFMAAQALADQAETIYPMHPDNVPAFDRWIARAKDLLARQGDYAHARSEIAPVGEERVAMVENMNAIRDLLPHIERDRGRADALHRESVEAHAADWDRARAEIAASEIYGNLKIAEQVGLVPLRRDPISNLWEFWVVLSGARPGFDAETSGYRLTPESGTVLVLLPGDTEFTIGSRERKAETGRQPNEDPQLRSLAPFFIGKYEISQAIWRRNVRENPSTHRVGEAWRGLTIEPLNPVETVTWFDCRRFARHLGLTVPTEAQWEYACRAGTDKAFYTGDSYPSLEHHENIRDRMAGRRMGEVPWEDGFALHAPIGSYRKSNGFGLHDMLGNVSEWCRDIYELKYPPLPAHPGDGTNPHAEGQERVIRGGHWWQVAAACRCAVRLHNAPKAASPQIGLRVARPLD